MQRWLVTANALVAWGQPSIVVPVWKLRYYFQINVLTVIIFFRGVRDALQASVWPVRSGIGRSIILFATGLARIRLARSVPTLTILRAISTGRVRW